MLPKLLALRVAADISQLLFLADLDASIIFSVGIGFNLSVSVPVPVIKVSVLADMGVLGKSGWGLGQPGLALSHSMLSLS